MEFAKRKTGLVLKFSEHIKSFKIKKEEEIKKAQEQTSFDNAKEEYFSIKKSLEDMYDEHAIESAIYKLKASELDLNRFLKSQKHKT